MGCQGLIIGVCGMLSTAGNAWVRPGFGVITRPDFCAWWGKTQVRQALHSTDGHVGKVQAFMGGSAELGRRVMGGVGAMGARDRGEESVRFMALSRDERMALSRDERMAQLARAYGATRTSAWRNSYERWTSVNERSREITRDHVKKKFMASGRKFVDGC